MLQKFNYKFMKANFTTPRGYAFARVLTYLSLFICLTLTAFTPSGDTPPISKPSKDRADHASAAVPTSFWGPLQLKVLPAASVVATDPIRFTIQYSQQTVRTGEPVELTITAELLNISPNLLFFLPGSSAYTLKMLLPPGFEQTGGDFNEYVADELSYPARPVVTYHIRGHFKSVTAGTAFRLLRGRGQSDQGLFVEKATLTLKTERDIHKTPAQIGARDMVLYVIAGDAAATNSASGAARAAAPSYRGFLDYAGCDAVSGWVFDANNTQQSQQVDIYINGVKAATILADQRRQDVANAFNIPNFSAYGYVWVIPAYYRYNAPLTLSVRPANTSTELIQSPIRTGNCPGTGTPPSTTPPVTTPPVTTPPVTPPATGGPLTMLAPTYNCATGAITFNTSGGDGTTIQFRASGISDWSSNPNQYLDAGSRVNADTPPFTIYYQQSGRIQTYTWSRQATCNAVTPPAAVTTTPPVTTPPVTTPPVTTPPVTTPPVTPPATGGPLTMLAPTYNCATGAITFNTSGGDGTTIRFMSPGISDWSPNPNQYLDAGSRVNADTPPFTIYYQQSGRTQTYTWSRQATCNGATPPVTTPPTTTPPVTTPPVTTPPVTPPVTTPPPVTPPATGGPLTMLAPTYNCATGAITFNTSGGDGTTIRFMSPGISDWSSNPNQYLDAGSRVNADTPPFTIYYQQSGRTQTYTWSRQATCNGATPPVTTPPTTTPPVTTPPVTTPPVTTPPTTTPPPSNSTSGFYGYRGDDFNYQPLPDSPTTDKFPVFENDKIKVTLALPDQYQDSQTPGLGGSVFQIYDKRRPGKTLVYNPLVWNGENDNGGQRPTGKANRIFTGQGLSECLYQNPRPYYAVGEKGEGPHDPTLGYNPNEVGDDVSVSGRLLKYGRTSDAFYTEKLPMIYGQRQVPANEVRMRKWGRISDRALVLNYESSFNRATGERPVTRGQEAPCLYVNNMRNFKFYNGNNPYSNDGITTFTAPIVNQGPDNTNGLRAGGQYVSEPWIGVFDDDGYGIALFLKDNIRSYIGFWGDGAGNNAEPNKGGSYGYIAHAMNEILDGNIKWRHRTEVIVGTVEEIRAYVYANSYRPSFKPAFKFNTAGREGWGLNSGDDSNAPHTWDDPYTGQARNGWKVYFAPNNNAAIKSPGLIWKANEFNKVYIRMAYTGSETQWGFRFRRNRQKGDGNLDYSGKFGPEEGARYPDGTADRAEQIKRFNVKGDGQFRVYEIDLSQNPEWRNVINEVSLHPHFTDGKFVYQSGESVIIDWIDTNPNGPSN